MLFRSCGKQLLQVLTYVGSRKLATKFSNNDYQHYLKDAFILRYIQLLQINGIQGAGSVFSAYISKVCLAAGCQANLAGGRPSDGKRLSRPCTCTRE